MEDRKRINILFQITDAKDNKITIERNLPDIIINQDITSSSTVVDLFGRIYEKVKFLLVDGKKSNKVQAIVRVKKEDVEPFIKHVETPPLKKKKDVVVNNIQPVKEKKINYKDKTVLNLLSFGLITPGDIFIYKVASVINRFLVLEDGCFQAFNLETKEKGEVFKTPNAVKNFLKVKSTAWEYFISERDEMSLSQLWEAHEISLLIESGSIVNESIFKIDAKELNYKNFKNYDTIAFEKSDLKSFIIKFNNSASGDEGEKVYKIPSAMFNKKNGKTRVWKNLTAWESDESLHDMLLKVNQDDEKSNNIYEDDQVKITSDDFKRDYMDDEAIEVKERVYMKKEVVDKESQDIYDRETAQKDIGIDEDEEKTAKDINAYDESESEDDPNQSDDSIVARDSESIQFESADDAYVDEEEAVFSHAEEEESGTDDDVKISNNNKRKLVLKKAPEKDIKVEHSGSLLLPKENHSEEKIKSVKLEPPLKKVKKEHNEKSIEEEFTGVYHSDSEEDDSKYVGDAEEILERAFKANPKKPEGLFLKKLVDATYWDDHSVLGWWIKKARAIK